MAEPVGFKSHGGLILSQSRTEFKEVSNDKRNRKCPSSSVYNLVTGKVRPNRLAELVILYDGGVVMKEPAPSVAGGWCYRLPGRCPR